MSCRACQKKNDQFFRELGESIGKQYAKYEEDGKTKYIPLNDFISAQNNGYLSQDIQVEVL